MPYCGIEGFLNFHLFQLLFRVSRLHIILNFRTRFLGSGQERPKTLHYRVKPRDSSFSHNDIKATYIKELEFFREGDCRSNDRKKNRCVIRAQNIFFVHCRPLDSVSKMCQIVKHNPSGFSLLFYRMASISVH